MNNEPPIQSVVLPLGVLELRRNTDTHLIYYYTPTQVSWVLHPYIYTGESDGRTLLSCYIKTFIQYDGNNLFAYWLTDWEARASDVYRRRKYDKDDIAQTQRPKNTNPQEWTAIFESREKEAQKPKKPRKPRVKKTDPAMIVGFTPRKPIE